MSEQEKGGAAAFIAGIEEIVATDTAELAAVDRARMEHVNVSQARAINALEGLVEWSKAQPVVQDFPGDTDGNALGDIAGAVVVALAILSARAKPNVGAALVCTRQLSELFFAAYQAEIMKAQG